MHLNLLISKLRAALIHLLVSALFVAVAWLISIYWYRPPFTSFSGGAAVLKIIFIVELVLGPTLSLVVFNPSKPIKELTRDYCVIGLLQISAFFYGLNVLSSGRPVYAVFVKDRIEVVSAGELADGHKVGFAHQLKFVGVEFPEHDIEAMNQLTFSSIHGLDIHLMPGRYSDLDLKKVRLAATDISDGLIDVIRGSEAEHVLELVDKVKQSDCFLVPIVRQMEFKSALMCGDNQEVDAIIDFDLFDLLD